MRSCATFLLSSRGPRTFIIAVQLFNGAIRWQDRVIRARSMQRSSFKQKSFEIGQSSFLGHSLRSSTEILRQMTVGRRAWAEDWVLVSRPYAIAAAVGSLMMRSTSRPAITPVMSHQELHNAISNSILFLSCLKEAIGMVGMLIMRSTSRLVSTPYVSHQT